MIFEIEPEIERAKNALLEAGVRGALLAGSGSSVFGVVDDQATRDRVIQPFPKIFVIGFCAVQCL